ncbi:hypothetical protein BDV95DRAFT_492508 [Massariosphaeria phaeospora]|uniref:RRM domain-containing protein n=1 Tax=Massariosphaeria phaeospora TaxID=100035 RepID=A0A7C8I8W2_9PLEO|nr:hypothetical protein BDV95DRAFT_492508 [Massariosphaeria phaeospora]
MATASKNTSFADFVKKTREQKKKEALAQEILGSRGRKANSTGAGSLPNTRNNNNPQKPTLLSRISGVQKPRSASAKPNLSPSIDGKWQHDLHKLNNPNGPPNKRLNRTASASQIDRNDRTYSKFRSAIHDNARNNARNTLRNNALDDDALDAPGFSIKGVATGGPYTVIATNFAPGTTSADIEAVMVPHAGEVQSCRLLTSTPTVMVELVLGTKEGADNIIATFNNKKADGRVLYVYMKTTPTPNGLAPFRPNNASDHGPPRSFDDMDVDDTNGGARSGSFQDGRFGFSENSRREPPRGPRRRY